MTKLAKLVGVVLFLSSVTVQAAGIAEARVFNPGPGNTDPNYSQYAPYQTYQNQQWPSPRFTVGTGANADCVTDNLTGLVWVKDLNTVNLGNPAPTLADAQTVVANLHLCGYSNWRLPTVTELRSLVNYAVPLSSGMLVDWLNAQGFINVHYWPYWTSTVSKSDNSPWFIDMGHYQQGLVNTVSAQGISNAYIWPVVGGSN